MLEPLKNWAGNPKSRLLKYFNPATFGPGQNQGAPRWMEIGEEPRGCFQAWFLGQIPRVGFFELQLCSQWLWGLHVAPSHERQKKKKKHKIVIYENANCAWVGNFHSLQWQR